MSESLYRRVQQQLNQYSMGFPEAASGVEIDILRSLFSESDAVLFMGDTYTFTHLLIRDGN